MCYFQFAKIDFAIITVFYLILNTHGNGKIYLKEKKYLLKIHLCCTNPNLKDKCALSW